MMELTQSYEEVTGPRQSMQSLKNAFLLSLSMMVTSAVDISIGTGKKSVESSTLNISLPSSAVSSSMRVILMHSCFCPGNKIKRNCPPTKSSPEDINVLSLCSKSLHITICAASSSSSDGQVQRDI